MEWNRRQWNARKAMEGNDPIPLQFYISVLFQGSHLIGYVLPLNKN